MARSKPRSNPSSPAKSSPRKSTSPRKPGAEESDEYDSGVETPEDSDDGDSQSGDDEAGEEEVGLSFLVDGELADEDDEEDETWAPAENVDQEEQDQQDETVHPEADKENTAAAIPTPAQVIVKPSQKRSREDGEVDELEEAAEEPSTSKKIKPSKA